MGPASWRGNGAPMIVPGAVVRARMGRGHTRLGEIDRVERGLPFGPGGGRSDRRGKLCG